MLVYGTLARLPSQTLAMPLQAATYSLNTSDIDYKLNQCFIFRCFNNHYDLFD